MAFLFGPSKKEKKIEKEIDTRMDAARLEDTIEMLKIINDRMIELHERIDTIERILSERLPQGILTEQAFKEEVETSEDIIEKIMEKVDDLNTAKSVRQVLEDNLDDKPSPVEAKRMEKILGLLQKHGKLSSTDLSKHTGLSRTRCNEYFKQMEEMGLVESFLKGREKLYKIK
jgi:Mn-dependent DtxR family transcriptional regulator